MSRRKKKTTGKKYPGGSIFLYNRSTLAIFIAVFIVLGSWLVVRPHAATAGELCANSGSGKCIQANSLSASNLVMNWNLAGGYQRLVQVGANICNGNNVVTSTCPFAVGYGFNNALINDGIYEFQFNSDRSMCVLGSYTSTTTTTRATIGPCSSYKAYWVVSHGTQLAQANEIANVASTNYYKRYFQVLESSGIIGGPVNVIADGSVSGGYTSWGWQYR